MPVCRIDALCECDSCGRRFYVELDLDEPLKGGAFNEFDDMIRCYIRAGSHAICFTPGIPGETVARVSLSGNNRMLCDVCTQDGGSDANGAVA